METEPNYAYELWVNGMEHRATIDKPYTDARRIAQALANTEGVEVGIVDANINRMRTVAYITGDENAYPELTLAERCMIVQTDVLKEMLADASSRTADARREYQTIVHELGRRAR